MQATVDNIAETIAGCRFAYGSESDLQHGVAAALTTAGLQVQEEVRLDPRNRIDLLTGRVGIEVKVASTADHVARQCRRYLASPLLDGLVLVTIRARHQLPATIAGKPVRVVNLIGAGL